MPTKANAASIPGEESRSVRLVEVDQDTEIAGVPGPGRWLIAEFEPTALFSLKISLATSSVGRTLVIPTPYAIKMALVDAAFRAGLADAECGLLLRNLVPVEVRIAPTHKAVVTHTFVKVRQESRDPNSVSPYGPTIAYREIAHLQGVLRWAFDLAGGDDLLARQLIQLLPLISYIGKRGSFVRFLRSYRARRLASEFTQPIVRTGEWTPPARAHIVSLDDFGPDADLETLSSYTRKAPRRNRHRRFIETIVPVGVVNTGPGFTLYGTE
ncbi:MAG: hypothetical protein IVW54_03540 [Candidatus Binataceae bacterium]|nr:hypothetical protein [Candidatus Binataceae bacterium]